MLFKSPLSVASLQGEVKTSWCLERTDSHDFTDSNRCVCLFVCLFVLNNPLKFSKGKVIFMNDRTRFLTATDLSRLGKMMISKAALLKKALSPKYRPRASF